MKQLLLLLVLGGSIPSFFSPKNETRKAVAGGQIEGFVQNFEDEKPLAAASIELFQNQKSVARTVSDEKGQFRIDGLEAGFFEAKIQLTGFETQRIQQIPVEKDQKTRLAAILKKSIDGLEEEAISTFRAVQPESDSALGVGKTSELSDVAVSYSRSSKAAPAVKYDEIRAMPAAPPPAESAPMDGSSATIKSERAAATAYYIDGVRVESAKTKTKKAEPSKSKKAEAAPSKVPEPRIVFSPETYEEKVAFDSPEHEMAYLKTLETPDETPDDRAGTLTAGEWNDLENWSKHWLDLQADGELDPFQAQWKMWPRHRFSVVLTNENDVPLVDCAVHFFDQKKEKIWSARTDNTGRAEGWAGFFQNDKMVQLIEAEAFVNGKKHDLGRLKNFTEGKNQFKITAPCEAPTALDIVFAVDATGSMGDEISYLQTELIDVLGRAKSQNRNLTLRTGSVFYRDQTDDYITRSSGLTTDSKKTVGFIKKQHADGGGDWPEAVHSALEEVVFTQKWSETAVARIVFLVLDASPHQDLEVKMSLQKSIAAAAEKGIRIVPVVASGIQKETEWLMKMCGLATNGSYVFLTDHSGIGEKHLEPTTDEYKVEALNDLLVRLIGEFSATETCDGKSAIVFENDPQNGSNAAEKRAFFYPNPASSLFMLDLPEPVEGISIYNSEGKLVKKMPPQMAGPLQISVADLPDGFFLIRILANGRWQSGKLVVARA